jgi:adenosylmethionine-8-amino-7-oxononanoate aminotransferase
VHDALLHPFARPARPESSFVRIVRAEGSAIWDADGKRYVDGLANLWSCHVGHGRSEIVAAVAGQLATLDCYNTFDPFTNDVAVAAAEAIRSRSPHPDGRVFLGCSGSDAIDTALKLVRAVHQRRGDTDRQVVLTRTRGYHGTNAGGTSIQGLEPNRVGWGDLVPHVVEVAADDVEAAARAFADHGERIAAVVAEPVQGAGGVHLPADGYLEGLRRLCDDHGALLVLDEVITGFGRTGRWFAAETFGVVPDLITFAKGVTSGYQPLSGVVLSAEVAGALAVDEDWMLRTGYTYSGHPASCAAALANLALIAEEGLVDRAVHVGARLGSALGALAEDGLVDACRGIGGLWAVDLGEDAVPVRDRLLDAGVVVRPIGQSLAMCPPLSIPDEDLDAIVDAIAADRIANRR